MLPVSVPLWSCKNRAPTTTLTNGEDLLLTVVLPDQSVKCFKLSWKMTRVPNTQMDNEACKTNCKDEHSRRDEDTPIVGLCSRHFQSLIRLTMTLQAEKLIRGLKQSPKRYQWRRCHGRKIEVFLRSLISPK